LPGPVRAVVGLLASAADEAKHLPDRAIELPMLAVSSALQMSLRAQQRYARLAARGDDVINRRTPGAEPPPWATFDEPVSADEVRAATLADTDPARARAASQLLDELLGTAAQDGDVAGDVNGDPDLPASVTRLSAKKEAATKTGAKKAPAAKSPAKEAVARAATKAVAKQTPAKKAVVRQTAAKGKTLNRPRHGSLSRFDTVGDE
ncbi:MAG: hypothetical protein ABR571_01335, partial [Jatrophihabitans sp.]|uniref:hypothetical protein n=1 Tax=Jatrophihabitans sp. TaxID=1932789 RepID=UPI003910AF53